MHISSVRSTATLQKNMPLKAFLGSPLLCVQRMGGCSLKDCKGHILQVVKRMTGS